MEGIRAIALLILGLATVLIVVMLISGTTGKAKDQGTESIQRSGGGIICNIECTKCCSGLYQGVNPEGQGLCSDAVTEEINKDRDETKKVSCACSC